MIQRFLTINGVKYLRKIYDNINVYNKSESKIVDDLLFREFI